MLGHQKCCFKSWYILVLPRCIINLDSCASCKIFCLTFPLSCTYTRCPIIKTPSSAIRKGVLILVFTLFLIFDTSLSLCCTCNICSRYVNCAFNYVINIPSKFISIQALNLLNSVSVRSSHTGDLLRAALFLCLRALATMFAFLRWYSI